MTVRALDREFKTFPLGLIDEPELPSRSAMDETSLDELTADVRAKGILQPLVIARVGDRAEVIAGHRRWHAANRAGLVEVPCVIYATKDAALEGVKYSENRFREDLNAADEAIWFSELLTRDCADDVDKLCAQLGEKRSYVENRLLLFSGDKTVFDALRAGKIKIGVAQQLNRCTSDAYRRVLLDNAIHGGATVAIVAGWIADWQRDGGAIDAALAAPSSEVPIAPLPEMDYFRCAVCASSEHIHLMRPINVHQHCKLAVLDKALAFYERRWELRAMPRTLAEAAALLDEVVERFPQLAEPTTA